jgi:hypothetical protein
MSKQAIASKKTVTISHFPNSHNCTSVAGIKETLRAECLGKDVTLLWVTTSGMNQVRFIKVADDGTVFESYTAKQFPWDELLSFLY